jgi:cysteinyl-tRNA synthetase
MAEKHLGLPFDIHGGGADLKFPHHENEIAQSCCAHGNHDASSFARYWVHNGFVTVEGEKMSKSLGNFLVANDLLKSHAGETLRLTLLSAHYRQPLDWSEKAVAQAKKQLDGFYAQLHQLESITAKDTGVPEDILEALRDDLNTPLALSRLHGLCRAEKDPAALKGQLLAAGALLGVLQQNAAHWLGYGGTGGVDLDTRAIEAMLEERQAAKKAKDFIRADQIRAELETQGILVEDTPSGPQWRKR